MELCLTDTLSSLCLGYGMGRGYYLFTSPISHIIIGVVLIWIGITGMFSGEGKYDERSFFEMNASYLLSLLAGLAFCAFAVRRLLP
ncbi:hypothetical protein KDL44_02545 [bacterium]|nr:hypothetical protein [bacterium]